MHLIYFHWISSFIPWRGGAKKFVSIWLDEVPLPSPKRTTSPHGHGLVLPKSSMNRRCWPRRSLHQPPFFWSWFWSTATRFFCAFVCPSVLRCTSSSSTSMLYVPVCYGYFDWLLFVSKSESKIKLPSDRKARCFLSASCCNFLWQFCYSDGLRIIYSVIFQNRSYNTNQKLRGKLELCTTLLPYCYKMRSRLLQNTSRFSFCVSTPRTSWTRSKSFRSMKHCLSQLLPEILSCNFGGPFTAMTWMVLCFGNHANGNKWTNSQSSWGIR